MTAIVLSVLLLGVVTLTRGYDKFFTIGPCTVDVHTMGNVDFKKVAASNNGIWSVMRVPNTKKYENMETMTVQLAETAEGGKYVMTVFEKEVGGESRKRLPIVFHDSGSGHATLDAKIDGKDTQLKMSVLAYEENSFIYYYLCSEYGGDIKSDYRFVWSHTGLTKAQNARIKTIDTQYGFNGNLKKLSK